MVSSPGYIVKSCHVMKRGLLDSKVQDQPAHLHSQIGIYAFSNIICGLKLFSYSIDPVQTVR